MGIGLVICLVENQFPQLAFVHELTAFILLITFWSVNEYLSSPRKPHIVISNFAASRSNGC